MSTITSVDTLLYKQMVPLADTGASTALATVVPTVKFKLDTCSMAPQGNTVTKPSPSGFVAVTFNDISKWRKAIKHRRVPKEEEAAALAGILRGPEAASQLGLAEADKLAADARHRPIGQLE